MFSERQKVLKAIGNAKRMEILHLIECSQKISQGELSQKTGLSESALSQHLAVLLKAGIVQFNRDKQFRIFQLADIKELPALLNCIRTWSGNYEN